MKKRVMVWCILLLLGGSALIGCKTKNESDLDIRRVTLLRYVGDVFLIKMHVLAADGTLQSYKIQPSPDSRFDPFIGEMPSEDEYTLSERTISKEDWDALIKVIDENNALRLPRNVSHSRSVYDADTIYIGIETEEAVFWTGGYNAGRGLDRANKRFRRILNTLQSIVE